MKKYLFTLAAAFLAVVAFAQKSMVKEPLAFNDSRLVKVEKNEKTPRASVKGLHVKGLASQKLKNQRRAAINSIDDLVGEFILCNYDYDYDSESQGLVEDIPARSSNALNIDVYSENTIIIYGIYGDMEKGITATVDLDNSKLTIPAGQVIGTSTTYGDISIRNSEAESDDEPLTATIYEGSIIAIDQIWHSSVVYQGKNARWGSFSESVIFPTNAIMEYNDGKADVTVNLFVEQDPETKDITVWNFAEGWNLVFDVTLNGDKTWIVDDKQVVYYSSNYGEFNLFGVEGKYLVPLTGTGTEATLTTQLPIYVYKEGIGGWNIAQGMTITLIDGTEFDYPEPLSLVTLPDGLTPVAMTSYYTTGDSSNRQKHEGTVNVAKDGTDVYIQGLDLQIPAAWVKGTLDENTGIVTIPVTYMGEASGTPHYFGGYGENGEPVPFVLEYSSSTDSYYGPSWVEFFQTESSKEVYYYSGLFIGTKPTALTMPADVTPIELPYAGKSLDSQSGDLVDISGKVKIGKKENLVYIQGFYDDFFENNCLVGQVMESEGSKFLVIPSGQYVGEFTNGFLGFALSYSYDSATGQIDNSHIYFTYDDTNNYLVLATPLVLSRSSFDINYYEDMVGQLEIGSEPAGIEAVKAVKEAGDGAWYTIGGQRVAQPTEKGLYIHNGKKVVIK